MQNDLEAGDTRSGLLIEGFEQADYLACVLQYEVGSTPLVTVPFVHGRPEFAGLADGYRNELPVSALYEDHRGSLTFTGLRWRGTNQGSIVSETRFDANVTFLGRALGLKDEYLIEQFTSYIDGLEEATFFRTVRTNFDTRSSSEPLLVSIDEAETIEWVVDETTYTIGVNTPWSERSGQQFTARTRVYLRTTIKGGATVSDHIRSHWPIRALLVLLHGTKLSWREHRVTDDQFPVWMASGPSSSREYVKVIPRRTVREFDLPRPSRSDVALPLIYIEQIGIEALEKWIRLYRDPDIARAVEPAVEVINGMSNFLEPQLIMAVLALDAFGYVKRGRIEGRLASNIKACFDAAHIDLAALGSNDLLAKALADTNNDLKHPDRGRRPGSLELGMAVDLAVAVLRMQIFDLLDLGEAAAQEARRSRDIAGVGRHFDLNKVTVKLCREGEREKGRFIRQGKALEEE
jgi:hypothetical protein